MRRPPFCTQKKCKLVINLGGTIENINDGGSCFCMGELEKAEVWEAGKTEHVNDITFCTYTPFKGWTRYVMNNEDFSIISEMLKGFKKRTGRDIKLYGD